MEYFIFNKISFLMKISIVIYDENNKLIYQTGKNASILTLLFDRLKEKNNKEQLAVKIHKDDFGVCYGHISFDEKSCIFGPMATVFMDLLKIHKYCQSMGVSQDEISISEMSVDNIISTAALLTKLFTGVEYTDDEIFQENSDVFSFGEISDAEKIKFNLDSDDEYIYRHTYQDERILLDMVREGNVEGALAHARNMDNNIGKLSKDSLKHWKNLVVISTTLCARAAIEVGVQPYKAYRVSGFYINKSTSSDDIFEVISCRNKAIEELTNLVSENKKRRHTSSYTEQCKDYIKKHYREKIYLDNIASSLGISDSYLSRLFKKETGICIQDYVVQIRLERAVNLLLYSNESIPRIAEYVNFPSQSYFGKVFKKEYGVTPRIYRDQNKPTEFLG